MCQAGFGSLDVAAGKYTCFYDTFAGGYGGRYASDGPDAVQSHGQNTENAPIEETELNYPVRINGLSLVEDSEGPGRFRGGLGLRKDYLFDLHTTFTVLADRDKAGPWGAFGGHSGADRRVRPRPRRRRDEAVVEDDARPRPGRRDQRPHLRRRRLRPARGARPRAGAARRARGQGQRRAGARRSTASRSRDRRLDEAATRERAVRTHERPPGRRHRRHVHRRDPDRRGDGRGLDREGADDAGRPLRGLHAGRRARARRGRRRRPAQVGFVVHATTVATNAIIEGKIARGGFVTTEGFRDLLEIARQVRPTLYDTQFEKATPLVPRDRAVDGRRAARPGGRGAAAARGRLRARGRGDPAARGGRVGRRLPAPRLRQPRARAAGRRRSSPRSCPASRSRSRPRSRPSSASTCAPRRRSSTPSSGRSSSATWSGSRAASPTRACRRSCS